MKNRRRRRNLQILTKTIVQQLLTHFTTPYMYTIVFPVQSVLGLNTWHSNPDAKVKEWHRREKVTSTCICHRQSPCVSCLRLS